MTATDAHVRIIRRGRSQGKTQEQAAAKASLKSYKTVRKYEGLGKLLSEMKKPRDYRTRSDPGHLVRDPKCCDETGTCSQNPSNR